MTALPVRLQAAVDVVVAEQGGSLRSATAELRRAYRAGGASRGLDLAAYLASRLPATFAAVSAALAETRRRVPALSPASLLDAGSGPGTASWAAVAHWPSLTRIGFIDNDAAFLALAVRLAQAGESPALRAASQLRRSLADASALPAADLAIVAYALAELGEVEQTAAVSRLWAAAETVVLVEPGTPAGFLRILAARRLLLAQGAQLAGPCPHGGDCPLAAPDWCHFSVRLPRRRAHMHAKAASVPFEDEKYAWVAGTRLAVAPAQARVIAPPRVGKVEIVLPLCTATGFEMRRIAHRDRDAYRAARKLDWGDGL